MSCASTYTPQLRARGFRMTSQRLAILHVLHHEADHLTPTVIYEKARQELPGLTEPTVYRTLEFLAENGLVQSSRAANGHLAYEIAGEKHHHLLCRRCGAEIAVEHAVLESLYKELETTSGYRNIDSHITFLGLCPDCQ